MDPTRNKFDAYYIIYLRGDMLELCKGYACPNEEGQIVQVFGAYHKLTS
jgi:hypothetical protein